MSKRTRMAALAGAVALMTVGGMPAQGLDLRLEVSLGRARPVDFVGATGGSFCDPANWSDGRVPGRRTDVRLDGTDDVVIDPAACGRARIAFRDLYAFGDSRFTTMAGTILSTRDEFIEDAAVVEFRSTESTGRLLDPVGGFSLNPSAVVRRSVILKDGSFVRFGLGGTRPASPGNVGAGHHATLTARTHKVGGARLEVALLYGFVPQDGDRFPIITGRFEDPFANAAEGARVFTVPTGGVGLFAHYTSDGLELQARTL